MRKKANLEIKKKRQSQLSLIIEMLKEAGEKGITNIAFKEITASLGARMSDLHAKGYVISSTHIGNGIYRYVLVKEPVQSMLKPKRAIEVLLSKIEENGGTVTSTQLVELLKKNDLLISRHNGALNKIHYRSEKMSNSYDVDRA